MKFGGFVWGSTGGESCDLCVVRPSILPPGAGNFCYFPLSFYLRFRWDPSFFFRLVVFVGFGFEPWNGDFDLVILGISSQRSDSFPGSALGLIKKWKSKSCFPCSSGRSWHLFLRICDF